MKSIAIDIGGTTTTYGIVDDSGRIISKDSFLTRGPESLEEYLHLLKDGIRKMLSQADSESEIAGIGIGAPCANYITGEIDGATELPWPSPIPLKKIFENEFGVPVVVANDAKAAAIGEMQFGAAKGIRNFIMLTLGTGVGSGIVCDGHLLSGARGFAGELGHVSLSDSKMRKCNCGRYDCLQNYCSASGILETARLILKESDTASPLRDIPDNELSPKLIYDLAKEGDAVSVLIYEKTAEAIGKACASYAAFSDPEAFVFFGGVANAFDIMEPTMRKTMEENILFLYGNRIKLLQSTLNEADAALLGASALVFETLSK